MQKDSNPTDVLYTLNESSAAHDYFHQGNVHTGKGEYDLAVGAYTKAIELAPDYFECYFARAKVYEALDKIDLAAEDVKKVIEINPDIQTSNEFPAFFSHFTYRFYTSAENHYSLGKEHLKNGNNADALEEFNLSIKEYHDIDALIFRSDDKNQLYNLYLNTGNEYAECGNITRAIANYNIALENNPTGLRALTNRAFLFFQIGMEDAGLQDLQQAQLIQLKNSYHDLTPETSCIELIDSRDLVCKKNKKRSKSNNHNTKNIALHKDNKDKRFRK